jgi:hypothetical protein
VIVEPRTDKAIQMLHYQWLVQRNPAASSVPFGQRKAANQRQGEYQMLSNVICCASQQMGLLDFRFGSKADIEVT